MATIYFISNADSGDGTLRDAITNASAGDIIAPDPTAFSGVSEITIQLSSGLPLASVSIVGSPTQRIILDRQSGGYFFRVATRDKTLNFSYVDFANGSRTTNLESPFYIGTVDGTTVTFNNCKFYNNFGYYAGFLRGVAGATNTTLTFNNCLAYNNRHDQTSASADFMAFQSAANPTIVFNGCTIDASSGNQSFTNLSSYAKNDCIYKTTSTYYPEGFDPSIDFVNHADNDYRLAPGSAYLTGGSLTGTDILGHTRTGSIGAYDGSWLVADAIVSSDTTVDYLEISASGTLTLSGSDRILTVSKGVYFTSGGAATSSTRGYIVLPAGASASALTLTNVVACYSGAGASNLSAATTGISWSSNDSTVSVVLELYSGSAWTTITQTSGTSYSTTLAEGAQIRLFDGVSFLTATVPVTPTPSGEVTPFWTIKRWAVVDTSGGTSTGAWDVNSWIVVSAGGSYSVNHWALDPEVE